MILYSYFERFAKMIEKRKREFRGGGVFWAKLI